MTNARDIIMTSARAIMQRVLYRRAHAYKTCFLIDGKISLSGEIVLSDLAKFCRAKTSTAIVSSSRQMIDPFAMALAEGRREVFLRIQQYQALEPNEIQRLREAQEDN